MGTHLAAIFLALIGLANGVPPKDKLPMGNLFESLFGGKEIDLGSYQTPLNRQISRDRPSFRATTTEEPETTTLPDLETVHDIPGFEDDDD